MVLQPLLLALKGNPQVKYAKKPNDIACFFRYFCHNIGYNLAQILPQDHTQFDFLVFSNEVCYGIQLILKNMIGIQ